MQGHLVTSRNTNNTRIKQIVQHKSIHPFVPRGLDECVLDHVRTRLAHQGMKHLRSPLEDELKQTNDNVISISASLRKGKAFLVLK
jgi:hypothetical protein